MRRALLSLAVALAAPGCGEQPAAPVPGTEFGAELAASPSLSTSGFNEVACTDCHAVREDDPRILPGATLLGAAARPSWWGGTVLDLREAVDVCLVYFMKSQPLDPRSDEGRALYDYLVSLADRGPAEAQPLTVVPKVAAAPPRGDAARGAEVHARACAACHGTAGTGAGSRLAEAPMLPGQARAEAIEAFPDVDPAVVFTEKIRHGLFFGIGGNMPLYPVEALSDEDIGALLAFYEM